MPYRRACSADMSCNGRNGYSYAQAHPSALNYGTLGPGSNPEMFLKWMNRTWNVNIVGVPYRGGGPIAQGLVAGELRVAKMGFGNFLGLLGTGKIKPLAVAAARRSVLVPEIPTLTEAGIDFPPFGWWGLAAPRGVPQPIVDRLNTEFATLYREAKFVEYLEKQAVLPAPGTPDLGKIKPLAVAAARRSVLVPEIPTLTEAGIDFPPFGWWGLAAPRGVPQPIVDRLNTEFATLYREAKFVEYLEKQAVLPAPGTPAEFSQFLKRDRQ